MNSARRGLGSLARILIFGLCTVATVAQENQLWGPLEPVSASIIRLEVPGVYLMFGELTTKFSLHLFPDGETALVDRTLSSKGSVVGIGGWTVEAEGILKLRWRVWTLADSITTKHLRMSDEYRFQQRSRSGGHREFLLVPARQKTEGTDFPFRVERYVDWELEKADLFNRANVKTSAQPPKEGGKPAN